MKTLQDLQIAKSKRRQELVAAMRWWRARHPEYTDVKVASHGWYGHYVSGVYRLERQCLARVSDVMSEWRAATAAAKGGKL